MSSSTRRSDPEAGAVHLAALRLVLAIAYPLLAHLAGLRHDGGLAALALGDVAVIVLLQPLARLRGWAWLALLAVAAGLWWLARSPYALVPLLLVPVAIIGLVSYGFGRTLSPGRTPLISRIVMALEPATAASAGPVLTPELCHYTRALTAAWAWLLGMLALCNLLLATLAVPHGLLASFGVAPPLVVGERQWSWFANVLNYGIVGGFFLLEFEVRKRRFPGRYRSFLDFLQRMARLGPGFWRDLFLHA